jgi:SAM-dependent methyltransferase
LAEHSLDLVVMHSVAQYLMAAGAGALFALFHRLLKPGGVLVVSDVMSPEVMAATDAWALLRFGQANGFFFAALWGVVRARLSDYWRLRSLLGLTRYSEDAMIEKLGATGFAAECAPTNIGHKQARKTYYARPR